MDELTIRACDGSGRDYELVAMVDTALSGKPTSTRRLRELDSGKLPGKFRDRSLVYLSDDCIGATLHFDLPNNVHICLYSLIPEQQGKGFDLCVLEHLLDDAAAKGAEEVKISARTDHSSKLEAIEQLGFKKNGETYVTSELDLSGFDPEIGHGREKTLKSQGIEIVSAAQLAERGIDWLYQFYGFLAAPATPPYEQFKRQAEAPEWFPESQFAACIDKQTIGLTSVNHIVDEPGFGLNNLTIVVHEMKRKGIATAMKCASLDAAKKAGIRKVRTCNEGSSAMLIVNRQLGYQPIEEEIGFVKLI